MTAQETMLTDEEIVEAGEVSLSIRSDVPPMPPEFGNFYTRGFYSGARFARDRYEARLAEDAKVREELVEALEECEGVLDEASFTYTNAYAATVAALAAAKEIK